MLLRIIVQQNIDKYFYRAYTNLNMSIVIITSKQKKSHALAG